MIISTKECLYNIVRCLTPDRTMRFSHTDRLCVNHNVLEYLCSRQHRRCLYIPSHPSQVPSSLTIHSQEHQQQAQSSLHRSFLPQDSSSPPVNLLHFTVITMTIVKHTTTHTTTVMSGGSSGSPHVHQLSSSGIPCCLHAARVGYSCNDDDDDEDDYPQFGRLVICDDARGYIEERRPAPSRVTELRGATDSSRRSESRRGTSSSSRQSESHRPSESHYSSSSSRQSESQRSNHPSRASSSATRQSESHHSGSSRQSESHRSSSSRQSESSSRGSVRPSEAHMIEARPPTVGSRLTQWMSDARGTRRETVSRR